MNTVLITGSSTGIGRAAVKHFVAKGWKVAATMRSPEKESELQRLPGVKLYALDVTKPESVDEAFAAATRDLGRIGVVVNNAGYGVDGVFEAMTDDVIERQYNTNVFGLMRVTRAAIAHMRQHGGGSIVQIASVGGRLTFPLYSIYHGTKWAVEGFSESLHYELRPLNIKVRLVEPGAVKTDFYTRSREFVKPDHTTDYNELVSKAERLSMETGQNGIAPEQVAATIYRAATDKGWQMRWPVGWPAPMLWLRKYLLPDTLFFKLVRSSYKI